MALYIRFMICLAVGLVGLGLVLKTVMETLLQDWDVVAELGEAWRERFSDKRSLGSARVEDLLLDREMMRTGEAPTVRLIDVRRQQLAEVAAVENRLKRPGGPIVLTPLPAPRGLVNLAPTASASAVAVD